MTTTITIQLKEKYKEGKKKKRNKNVYWWKLMIWKRIRAVWSSKYEYVCMYYIHTLTVRKKIKFLFTITNTKTSRPFFYRVISLCCFIIVNTLWNDRNKIKVWKLLQQFTTTTIIINAIKNLIPVSDICIQSLVFFENFYTGILMCLF